MHPRLRSELRIKAFLRRCDLAFYPAAVIRRGDSDAGDIILHRTNDFPKHDVPDNADSILPNLGVGQSPPSSLISSDD